METPITIEALGRRHHVRLPDFAAREELAVAYSEACRRRGVTLLRACAAILGLCTRLGTEAGADYARHRFDALSYGGEMYSWLRQQGMTPADVTTQAILVLGPLTQALAPREEEVVARLGESGAGGGR